MMHIVHKYVDTFVLTSTAGSTSSHLFSVNGLYDPNITATGHQPSYFDTLTPIYNHYTVMSSTILVEMVVSTSAALVALYTDDDTSVPSAAYIAAEQPSASSVTAPVTSYKPSKLTKSWNAKSNFGGDILDNDELKGISTANPVEQMYFVIMASSLDGISNATVNCRATIS